MIGNFFKTEGKFTTHGGKFWLDSHFAFFGFHTCTPPIIEFYPCVSDTLIYTSMPILNVLPFTTNKLQGRRYNFLTKPFITSSFDKIVYLSLQSWYLIPRLYLFSANFEGFIFFVVVSKGFYFLLISKGLYCFLW